MAVHVTEYLELHMARRDDQLLEEDCAIAERGERLALYAGQRLCEVFGPFHRPLTHAAAACRRLQQNGIAYARRLALQRAQIARRPHVARHGWRADGFRRALGRRLRSHRADGGGWWADEDNTGFGAGVSKLGVLGEEAVAGVDRLGAAGLGGGDDRGDVEVALTRRGRANAIGGVGQAHMRRVAVGVGIDGDGAYAKLLAGEDETHGDLATIGDQD